MVDHAFQDGMTRQRKLNSRKLYEDFKRKNVQSKTGKKAQFV